LPKFHRMSGSSSILPLRINRRNALNPFNNSKVSLRTRTKRSQRLLIIRTLIRRQSDLIAIELNHHRRLLRPCLVSCHHARRRRQRACPKLPQRRYSKWDIILHRHLVTDRPVRNHPITLLHIVPSLEMPSTGDDQRPTPNDQRLHTRSASSTV